LPPRTKKHRAASRRDAAFPFAVPSPPAARRSLRSLPADLSAEAQRAKVETLAKKGCRCPSSLILGRWILIIVFSLFPPGYTIGILSPERGAGMNCLTNLATFFPSPDDAPQPSPLATA